MNDTSLSVAEVVAEDPSEILRISQSDIITKGIYILRLTTEAGKLNKKIMLD